MSLKAIYKVIDVNQGEVAARFVYADDARTFCLGSVDREPHRVLAIVNDAQMLYEVYGTTPPKESE